MELSPAESNFAHLPLPGGDGDFARATIEGFADALVVYDRNWRMRFENPAAVRAYRRAGRQTSMMGKILWEEFPDLAGTLFEREMRRAMRERTTTSFVERRASTGHWSQVTCIPLPDGGVAVVWKDITEQQRAEEALHYLTRASEILTESLDYEQTIDALTHLVVPELADFCAVSLVNASGGLEQIAVAHTDPAKVQWARELNQRFPVDLAASTGLAQVIRTGQPLLYPLVTEQMLAAMAESRNPEYVQLMREVGFTSVIIAPLTTHGRTIGALTLVSAESGRRYGESDLDLAKELARRAAAAVDHARLYREALDSKHEAELANQSKSKFLAHMSHELRTPLNAIAGYAELLQLGIRGTLSDGQRADLDRIQRSQRHLLSLINDVLNYTKLDAGRVHFDIQALSLKPILVNIEPLFAPRIQSKKLRYDLQLPDGDLRVIGDEEKVQQILLNLVSNAVKFTGAGGFITMSAEHLGDVVEVRVSDTGVGISRKDLEAIFEPFVQLRQQGQLSEGTGLGLSISRDLAVGMGGTLTADSDGMGSTFTLTLPSASR